MSEDHRETRRIREWTRRHRLINRETIDTTERIAINCHEIGVVIDEKNFRFAKSFDARCDFARIPLVVLIAEGDEIRTAEAGRPHEIAAIAEAGLVLVDVNGKWRVLCELC